MNSFFKSISIRLSIRFTIILSVAVLLLSILFVGIVHSFIRSGQDFELMENADNLEMNFNEFERFKNEMDEAKKSGKDESSIKRPSIKSVPYYISFIYADSDGKILHSNDPFLPFLPDTEGSTKKFLKKNFFIDGDLNILYYTKKIESKGVIHFVMTSMDMTRESSSTLFNSLPKSISLVSLPILIVSFLLSFLIVSRTIRPVKRVTKAASKISSSNLGTERLLPSKHNDEIQDLISTFNSLFDRLKVDFDREKQFTSDVSHELKTPIAVISGQVGLLLRWGKDDKAQLEKSLETIKKETKSMQSIVENLLQMSRLERGTVKPNFEQVDISEMFERIKDEFKIISPAVQIDCKFDDKNNCKLKTDSELLHQVMTVIVSNSVKYAGNDCKIILNSKIQNSKMQITIEDNGKGFAEETLPHVFERFYRGDESHTRSVGGSGLGLSIAKTIVEALNGTISAENSENHGARLILNMQMK